MLQSSQLSRAVTTFETGLSLDNCVKKLSGCPRLLVKKKPRSPERIWKWDSVPWWAKGKTMENICWRSWLFSQGNLNTRRSWYRGRQPEVLLQHDSYCACQEVLGLRSRTSKREFSGWNQRFRNVSMKTVKIVYIWCPIWQFSIPVSSFVMLEL